MTDIGWMKQALIFGQTGLNLSKDEPLLRADFHEAIGYCYMALRHFSRAERPFLLCCSLLRRALEPGDYRIAMSMNNLGAVYQQNRRYAEARLLDEDALTFIEDSNWPDHPFALVCVLKLADIHEQEGLFSEAALLRDKYAQTAGHPHTAGDRRLNLMSFR